MFTITVKKHLSEKLSPMFTMLNRLEGVLESISILKEGGENLKQYKKGNPNGTDKPTIKPKKENEPKDNVASDSKGKENFNEEPIIDNNEVEEPDEH
ncbi:unnamed protein product [Lactuca saligna]|uniref:Uncharacterized protein n=1 Tax=Lactuca saligna TaxID=75948 RepID=A0AA35YZA6_LACSI|nr:unnamed protein product [Lactuca saligna]